jgi:aryl-alcohol dehydrogenase-like predicted oxidoreductase
MLDRANRTKEAKQMAKGLPTAVLGRTGLKVTRLSFGAMELRDAPRGRPVSDEQAKAVLNTVLDSGINFIDTSNDYGRSEEFIGRHISRRRSEYYLATKCGCRPGGGQPHVWTKENLFRGLAESLQRLKTDYVDIMQLHNPTVEECQQGDLVAALQEMKRQGKVRWIGISTTLPHLPTYVKWSVFDEFQIPYSGIQREHEEWIAKAAQAGIGTVIRGGVAKGAPGESGLETYQRSGATVTATDVWKPFVDAKLDELRAEGESRTAFMLRFTLSHPQVHTIIVGTLNPEHVKGNVQAAQRGPLPAKVYAEAKRRLESVGLSPTPAS